MRYNKAVILVFCFIIQIANTLASNFKDGYIITLRMDTLYGQIENGNYSQNALECRFRKSMEEAIQSYKPDELYAYRFINGKYYISKYIVEQRQTVFLEYLIKGSLDVYFQQLNTNDNRFYVSTDTLPLRYLKYGEQEVYINDKRYVRFASTSVDILKHYTSDCPELIPAISKLGNPEHKNMIKLATKYHNMICSEGACQVYEKKMPASVFLTTSFGVGFYPLSDFYFNEDYTGIEPSRYFSNAMSVFFQQSWISESTYLGIGYADYYHIPISMYFIPEGKGLLHVIGYEMDINHFGEIQNLALGFRIPHKKWSFTVTGNLTTYWYIYPLATSLRMGVMYQLR